MIYIVSGLILGIIAGLNLNFLYSPQYAVYISLAILALINSIANTLLDNMNGDVKVLKSVTLLLSDLVFALFLGFIGEQLGLPIYLAPVFAFGNNTYKKIREIVELLIGRYDKNK
jgi:small basic protein